MSGARSAADLKLSARFPGYAGFSPAVPVWCATPHVGRTIVRFFDSSPFSPSGRFLAVTRLPCEDRYPRPGEMAEVVLVDLQTGDERVVAATRGWDTQLGAQVQWGGSDAQLFYNDVDPAGWRPYGVVLDPQSGASRRLDGTVYNVSADGRWAVSPCLRRITAMQSGYGVLCPDDRVLVNRGAADDDGIYLTNVETGRCRLLISWRAIVASVQPHFDLKRYDGGDFYGFHVKWNPQGDRLMLVLRWVRGLRKQGCFRAMRKHVLTLRPDGSAVRQAISAEQWGRGGNHPNWCPDGEHILMNLNVPVPGRSVPGLWGDVGRVLSRVGLRGVASTHRYRFVKVRFDGSDLQVAAPSVMASGHPTLHPDQRHILTDAYPQESVSFGDGTVPIRLIDTLSGHETTLVRIGAKPAFRGQRRDLRVDPHPAWDPTFRYIAFNACPDGTRRVYVADLQNVLETRRAAA